MGPMSTLKKTLTTAATAAIAVALASCAAAAQQGPVEWDTQLDLGVPGDVLETHPDVTFYPACGNETLTWDGTVYYPYNPSQLDDFPDPTDVVTRASALETPAAPRWARMSAQLPAVAPPQPGDDTGTLVVYEGGHAYWESDNGELDAWLTTTELEYMWVC